MGRHTLKEKKRGRKNMSKERIGKTIEYVTVKENKKVIKEREGKRERIKKGPVYERKEGKTMKREYFKEILKWKKKRKRDIDTGRKSKRWNVMAKKKERE